MGEFVAVSSGSLTASGPVVLRNCRIISVSVVGTSCTATVYDNPAAASGKVVMVAATSSQGGAYQCVLDQGVECLTGAYVSVSGTSPVVVIHYALL